MPLNLRRRYRDARSGRFVPLRAAEADSAGTVSESTDTDRIVVAATRLDKALLARFDLKPNPVLGPDVVAAWSALHVARQAKFRRGH